MTRDVTGRYTSGTSGNPKGKPKGARNRSSVMLEKILADNATAIIKAIVKNAKAGDSGAQRLCAERLIPVLRERRIDIALAPITDAASAEEAQRFIVAAAASGELLLSEAASLGALVDLQRAAISTNDHAERLARLEANSTKGRA